MLPIKKINLSSSRFCEKNVFFLLCHHNKMASDRLGFCLEKEIKKLEKIMVKIGKVLDVSIYANVLCLNVDHFWGERMIMTCSSSKSGSLAQKSHQIEDETSAKLPESEIVGFCIHVYYHCTKSILWARLEVYHQGIISQDQGNSGMANRIPWLLLMGQQKSYPQVETLKCLSIPNYTVSNFSQELAWYLLFEWGHSQARLIWGKLNCHVN